MKEKYCWREIKLNNILWENLNNHVNNIVYHQKNSLKYVFINNYHRDQFNFEISAIYEHYRKGKVTDIDHNCFLQHSDSTIVRHRKITTLDKLTTLNPPEQLLIILTTWFQSFCNSTQPSSKNLTYTQTP